MAKYRSYTALTRRPIGGGQGPPPSARLTKYFAEQEDQAELKQFQSRLDLTTAAAADREKQTRGLEAFSEAHGGGLDIEGLPFGDTEEHFTAQQDAITSGELGFASPTLQRRWDTLEQAHSETQWNQQISEDDKRLKLEAIEEGMRPLIKMAKPTRDARDRQQAEAVERGEAAAERGFFIDEKGQPQAFERGGGTQTPEQKVDEQVKQFQADYKWAQGVLDAGKNEISGEKKATEKEIVEFIEKTKGRFAPKPPGPKPPDASKLGPWPPPPDKITPIDDDRKRPPGALPGWGNR